MLRKSCLIGGQKTGAIITPVESIERAKDPSLDVLEKMKEADVGVEVAASRHCDYSSY